MSFEQISSVFITGANRGIGLEFVKQLVALKSPPKYIFASYRKTASKDIHEFKQLANKHVSIVPLQLDVTDQASIEIAISKIKSALAGDGLDILINNAGILKNCTLENVTEEDLMEEFRINAVAPIMIAKACLPLLKQSVAKHGIAAILNVTSSLGTVHMDPGGGLYGYRCSKAALNKLTKSLSEDLLDLGIVAVGLRPGWVKTDMGGPGAEITAEESVRGMVREIQSLTINQTGINAISEKE